MPETPSALPPPPSVPPGATLDPPLVPTGVDRVRLTVGGEDVEVATGLRLGAVRIGLVPALGRDELRTALLAVDGRTLDDDALTGRPPLVEGADVVLAAVAQRSDARSGPGTRRPGPDALARARQALAADHRWESVAGPHAGLVDDDLGRASRGAALVVGRRGGAVKVRSGRGWGLRGPGRGLRWRDGGLRWRDAAQEPTPVRPVLLRAGRRPVRLGPVPRSARHGDAVEVRGSSGATGRFRLVVTAPDDAPSPARSAPLAAPTMLLSAAVPALVLAAVTGRPLFVLVALAGPLTLVVASAVRRRRRTSPAPGTTAPGWTDLASDPPALVLEVVSEGGAAGTAGHERHHGRAGAPVRGHPPDAPRPEAVAATGPLALARARAAVCAFAVAAPGAPVHVVGDVLGVWSWARWVGARPGPPEALPGSGADTRPARGHAHLVVMTVHGAEDARRASEWWARAPAGTTLLVVAPDGRVPAWCDREVGGAGIAAHLAERLARALAPRARAARSPGAAARRVVGLADVLGLDTSRPAEDLATAVALRWRAAPTAPVAPLGTHVGDPCASEAPAVEIDVAADGPHGLVAGTTGAGKSELLQTLVMSLALTHPPERLTFVLVDHKGGAGLGACVGLPHVAGVATDLEPGSAGRALAALRAELRERETLLARHGVPDLDALRARTPGACPPRVLVVVDELRALTDDDPGLLPSFLRIAAQGRSLGLHLVLATQRPAGAVSADVRANVGLRVALRVAGPSDSRDVVDVPDAADLPADAPGLAVVVTSRHGPRTVRCAWTAAATSGPAPAVRRAGPTTAAVRTGHARSAPLAGEPGGGVWHGPGVPALLAQAARDALALDGRRGAEPLWRAPLPLACVGSCDAVGTAGAPVPVALLDVPDERRRATAVWDPARGHLHVEGPPGSGRSTTLRAVAHAWARTGGHVHLLGGSEAVATTWSASVPPVGTESADDGSAPEVDADVTPTAPDDRFGTWVDADDPRRARTLLDRLLAGPVPAPTLVLVDDAEEMLAALARTSRGAGVDALVALARRPGGHGVRLAFASSRALPAPLAATVGPRLVLGSTDRATDVGRGLPRELAGLGGPPGRGVWTGAGPARLAQAFLPGPARHGAPGADGTRPHPASGGPLRLLPLPARPSGAALAELATAAQDAPRWHAPLGHGGDDAGPRLCDVSSDVLVAGPPGSGRTTLLARLARHAATCGPTLVLGDLPIDDVPARPGPLGRAPDQPVPDRFALDAAPADARPRVVRLPATPAGAAEAVTLLGEGSWTLVVDDVDVLARLLPAEHDRLAAAAGLARTLLAASTSGASLATRGLLGRARAHRRGVLLDPGRPGTGDVLAVDVAGLVEPGPCPPGRGVLVDGRAVELVQCLPPGA